METPLFDVAIVGAGPTGTLLANLLGQSGVRVALLDRDPTVSELPRAVHFDGECMRIFQNAGLADRIAQLARIAPHGTRFMTPEGQTLLIRRGFEGNGLHGWAVNWFFHQPDLERVLRRGLVRFPNVTLKVSHNVTEIEIGPDNALLRGTDLVSGRPFNLRARFVVAADGGRSLGRKALDCNMEDLGLHQPWLVVDVLVDPNSPRVQVMPQYTIQMCDPQRPMTMIYVGGNRRRWEIMVMPGDDPARMTEPAFFWPLLSRWIGPKDATLERSALYTFHSLIAHGWRRGPLLLAGDACHMTPPFLGQGMCAGLRDAANLAWKLALVVKGRADAALLDSYESERLPHVTAFIELAVRLGNIIQTTDSAVAAERDRSFTSGNPEIFQFPDPALGPGVSDQASPFAGKLFPQPRLADGTRLDDLCGGRFAVIGAPALLDGVDAEARAVWARLGTAVVADSSGEVAAALANFTALAVLLRPDGYIFGTARDAAQLSAITRRLTELLVSAPGACLTQVEPPEKDQKTAALASAGAGAPANHPGTGSMLA